MIKALPKRDDFAHARFCRFRRHLVVTPFNLIIKLLFACYTDFH